MFGVTYNFVLDTPTDSGYTHFDVMFANGVPGRPVSVHGWKNGQSTTVRQYDRDDEDKGDSVTRAKAELRDYFMSGRVLDAMRRTQATEMGPCPEPTYEIGMTVDGRYVTVEGQFIDLGDALAVVERYQTANTFLDFYVSECED